MQILGRDIDECLITRALKYNGQTIIASGMECCPGDTLTYQYCAPKICKNYAACTHAISEVVIKIAQCTQSHNQYLHNTVRAH